MYFRSKRSLPLGILVWGAASFPLITILWEQKFSLLKIIIQVVVYIYVSWFWFGTGYRFMGDTLKLRCGPASKRISLSTVSRIKKPGTEPSLVMSLAPGKAIRICYGENNEEIAVSPADAKGFIKMIKERCPRVKLIYNHKNVRKS